MHSFEKPTTLIPMGNGRVIEVCEYGAEDGEPYLFIPGFLGCLRQAAILDDDARALGMKLIAINKPGIGRSTFYDIESARAFGQELMRLADALHLERFGVIGISLSSSFVLACGAVAPHRITALAAAGILPPMENTTLTRDMRNWRHHALQHFEKYQYVLRRFFLSTSFTVRSLPSVMVPLLTLYYSRPDPVVLNQPDIRRMLRNDIRGVFLSKSGALGLLQEARLASHWQFTFDEVTSPVLLIHGRHDALAPSSAALQIALRLPNARTLFIPGNHFAVIRSARQSLEYLKRLSDKRETLHTIVDQGYTLIEEGPLAGPFLQPALR